jgi:hypothetical protein
MKVNPSHTGEVAAAQIGQGATKLATKASASSATFASVLAQQSDAATQTTTQQTAATVKLRKGESMSAVSGHAYAEISGGGRDGLYVNTSGNTRNGLAFVLVQKNGREYHIYGTGKDRLVVALRKPDSGDTNPATPNTTSSTGAMLPTVSAS